MTVAVADFGKEPRKLARAGGVENFSADWRQSEPSRLVSASDRCENHHVDALRAISKSVPTGQAAPFQRAIQPLSVGAYSFRKLSLAVSNQTNVIGKVLSGLAYSGIAPFQISKST